MKCHQQKNQQITFNFWILLEQKLALLPLSFHWRKEEGEQSPIFFLRFHKEKEFDGSINGVCCLMLLSVSTSFN